jgi:hypothetical protein
MKKPQKFTLPRSIVHEIKARSEQYSLSASGFVEVAIEYLRECHAPKETVLAQEDNTHDMIGVCYAVNDSDFRFIKQMCYETGVKKRLVILAAVDLFIRSYK